MASPLIKDAFTNAAYRLTLRTLLGPPGQDPTPPLGCAAVFPLHEPL